MSDYAVKATTTLLYHDIPEAVEAYPATSPTVIARGLVDRMTSEARRAILEQLVSHRVQTAQVARSHARHQVSQHD